jgi:hypothetical protein
VQNQIKSLHHERRDGGKAKEAWNVAFMHPWLDGAECSGEATGRHDRSMFKRLTPKKEQIEQRRMLATKGTKDTKVQHKKSRLSWPAFVFCVLHGESSGRKRDRPRSPESSINKAAIKNQVCALRQV